MADHTHKLEDRESLLDRLRQQERSGEYEAAIKTLGLLVDTGEWRPAWETGQAWLDIATEGARICQETGVTFNPRLARYAANALRLLAPVAGHWLCRTCGGATPEAGPWCCLDRVAGSRTVPNPLQQYVNSLRVCLPGEWFARPSSRYPSGAPWMNTEAARFWQNAGWYTQHHVDGRRWITVGTEDCGDNTLRIYSDGRVECGPTCPPLPEVPHKENTQ